MVRIAIVDDEENMLAAVRECIEKSVSPQDEVKIYSFARAEDFLTELEQGCKFNILFSDIGLSQMSGMELGKIIHDRKVKIFLVFLTSHSEYAVESYEIEAYQYILKEYMSSRLPNVLHQILDKIKRESKQYVLVGTAIHKDKLYYRDIIYICKKKGKKYVQYITGDGVYNERLTLEQVQGELKSAEFIIIERGYIINIKHIARMRGNEILMDNNDNLVISRARFKEVKEKINLYWRDL